ncbi:ATP synthase subunit epsilon stunted [Haemaphysalis longicornis]
MTYWRAAGLTYLQFSSIAARAVRNSLKKELQQSASATPTESSIKMATWKDGKPIKKEV